MVIIRLARRGSKKRPFYHIVATDSRQPRDGRYIDCLGYYNPISTGNEKPLEIDSEKVRCRISQGAQLSQKVKYLLKKAEKSGYIKEASVSV